MTRSRLTGGMARCYAHGGCGPVGRRYRDVGHVGEANGYDVRVHRERVLLVGMMGAGKTTVGRALAARLCWRYLDNDELVVEAVGHPTAVLLSERGVDALRRAEAAALELVLSAEPPVVAAAAAGVVLDPVHRVAMRSHAFVVYLRAPVALLAQRVASDPPRPWLAGDPVPALDRLFTARESLYEQVAHLAVDVGMSVRNVVDRIVDALVELTPGESDPVV